VDYISGVIAAFVTEQLKSKVGFVGIAKKVMLFLTVAVEAQVDVVINAVEVSKGRNKKKESKGEDVQ